MLEISERAPLFTLTDQTGKPVSLQGLLENGPVVLYFYPADFTPGCTKEACTIRDLHGELVAAGLQVAGISPQGQESHQRFAEKHQLPFLLLSDVEKEVIVDYGVNGPLGFGVRRATFLIDQDGIIRDAVLADLRIGQHEEFIRQAIALQA
ncbi:MAG: peroxiredoxin [Gammaproteobacteria bacterium]|nr:peroxiredoxin [Gammaproteobacteria bacterium]MCZ6911718.1 peroxiredoxin [Pseudomonadota bacterium]